MCEKDISNSLKIFRIQFDETKEKDTYAKTYMFVQYIR